MGAPGGGGERTGGGWGKRRDRRGAGGRARDIGREGEAVMEERVDWHDGALGEPIIVFGIVAH